MQLFRQKPSQLRLVLKSGVGNYARLDVGRDLIEEDFTFSLTFYS